METTLLYIVAASAAALILISIGWYYYRRRTKPEQPRNADLEKEIGAIYEEMDGFAEQMHSLEIALENVTQKIPSAEHIEALRIKTDSLELQMSELQEFVMRNLKKMSTRAQRAEQLQDLMDESKRIDEERNQPDFFTPSPQNGRPRLVKR